MKNPFNILSNSTNEFMPTETSNVQARISEIISKNDIVLFMKGNSQFPQCGFSANSVAILNQVGKKFTTYDILKDPELRQALKEYSNWPTYPQLYFKGKLVGGNDIITEMFQAGDLQEVLGQ